MSRIDWSTAAQGAQVVPVLLIHGVGIVAVPEGVSITGISLGSVPTAWWPGNTYADFSAYLSPWLRLDDGLTISERAVPAASQLLEVSEVTLHLSDVDGAATELFEAADSFDATYITAEVSATATTIPVATTAAFPSSGIIYLDQEAIRYGSKTPTAFTTCTRGLFGSRPTRHLYTVSQGGGMGNPQVTSGAPEMTGRPATLWLARLSAGVIVDVQLEHFGTVGTGVSLMGGGDSTDDGYVITIDHAIKRMGQRIRGSAISVGGFAHPGNLSARTTLETPTTTDLTPLWVVAQDATTGETLGLNLLTGDAAAPDNGGWHPTRESYLAALNVAGAAAFTSPALFAASLDGDNLTVTVGPFTPHQTITAQTAWATTVGAIQQTAHNARFALGEMPKAWVPITEGSPVYLTASDYAAIPPAPSSPSAQFVLVFGDDDDRSSKRYARITAQGTSGIASYVVCTALRAPSEVRLVGMYNGLSRSTAGRSGGATASGFVVQEPTTARLGLYVSSDSWVEALRLVVESLDTEYACVADAIDWTHMRSVADAYPSAFTTRREVVVDLNTTLLSMLQNEAALSGFALVMHDGRVSIARIAEFATTEATAGTISDSDLDAAAPSPTYEKGTDGIVNTYTVVSPDDGVTVNVTDQTSRALYGGQGAITATLPRSVAGTPQDASRLYVQVFSQAVQVLGPLRYPYRHVGVQVPLNLYDYQIGDLLSATLWRVPDGVGGRGITDAVVQVVGRAVELYGDGVTGHVTYTLRLNPRNLQGYAPSALVAASGIAGAVVTLDTTTISTGGFAGAGYTDGGASTFATGDLVRLVEIDTDAPTASTQHTVTAISGATITLSPAPSATFATLAASALKVMVVYDDWGVITAGARATQQRYAYLALADATLDATHAARVFAA